MYLILPILNHGCNIHKIGDCHQRLESLLAALDQGALRVKENKSAVGFARKYLASLNPDIADACMRSIHLADSTSTRGLEDRSESLIDILDSLPFIVSTVQKITSGNEREQTLAATCFLLTKAVLGHETIIYNASYADPCSDDYATHQAYQRYRLDPRSQQTAPQRVAAAINSAFGVEMVSLSDSNQLEDWYTWWNLWNIYGPAVLWCLTLATDSDNTPRRDGAFLRILYFWARRCNTQQTRKQCAPQRMEWFFDPSMYKTFKDYEKEYAPLYE